VLEQSLKDETGWIETLALTLPLSSTRSVPVQQARLAARLFAAKQNGGRPYQQIVCPVDRQRYESYAGRPAPSLTDRRLAASHRTDLSAGIFINSKTRSPWLRAGAPERWNTSAGLPEITIEPGAIGNLCDRLRRPGKAVGVLWWGRTVRRERVPIKRNHSSD